MTEERQHSLDALRAAMMLLGLVLHAGASYTYTPLRDAWPFHDPPGSLAFDLLLFFIHLFRMPAFFVVAGLFGALVYYRDGPRGFLRNRGRRVGLPLLLFWVTALPLAGLGFVFATWREGVTRAELLPRGSFLHEPVLGHLWFLYDLLIFYIAAVLIVALGSRAPEALRSVARRITPALVLRPWGVLLLGLITTVTLLPMKGPGLETSAAILPVPRVLVAYGVFFAFGWCLYPHRQALLESLAQRWGRFTSAGCLVALLYLVILLAQRRIGPRVWHVSAVTAAGLAVWLLIFGIVGLFVRRLATPRPRVRYLSDASYWIYVTHLAPITWTAGLLAPFALHSVIKFGIVLAVTTFVTLLTYHWCVRRTWLGVLLNGRAMRRQPPDPVCT